MDRRVHAFASALTLAVGVGCGEPVAPGSEGYARVTTTELPRGLTGLPYEAVLAATGGEPPYTWELREGALPLGLTLSGDGIIGGTPTLPASTTIRVHVAGSNGLGTTRLMPIDVLRLLAPDERCEDHPGAVASFADASLEYAVTQALRGSERTCANLRNISNLFHTTSHPAGVASLRGIQNLTRLNYLLLVDYIYRDNSITDLGPLAGLDSLEFVDLRENEIQDVSPLAGLRSLRTLILNDNRVSDLTPLAGLVDLEQLWVGRGDYLGVPGLSHQAPKGNPITDLDAIAGMIHLESLWIFGQAVTDLDALAAMADLRDLNALDNDIADVTGLAGKLQLESANLAGNVITDITPLSGLPNVWAFDLARNAIVNGPVQDLPELLYLDLSDNAIEQMGPFTALPKLQTLFLAGNEIQDLSPLSDVSNTRWLDLSRNQITDLSPLRTLGNLDTIDLSGNGLLTDIRPLLANPGLGPPQSRPGGIVYDRIDLRGTSVSCTDIAALRAKGPLVTSEVCP